MTKKLNIAQGCIVDRSVLLQFFLPLKVIFDLFGGLEILKHADMKLGPYYHFLLWVLPKNGAYMLFGQRPRRGQ